MVDISEFTADNAPATATHIAGYKAAGFVLVPIPSGKKGPNSPGWQKRESCNPPDSWAQNVGLAHAYSGTMALDIDNVKKATPWLTGFGVDLSLLLDDMDAVRIDSGRENRAKLLYRLPEGVEALPSVKYKDASHDVVDFRCGTKGGTTVQDVLPPSIHPDTEKPYTWAGDGSYQHLPDLPPELLKVWQGLLDGSIPNKVNQKPRKKPEATTQKPPATVTPLYRDDTNQDEVEDALQWISPDCPYDDWVNVLMALHSTGAAWAFSSADAFSQRGTKYESGDVEKKWRSFTPGGGIGIKTLYQMARAGGWQGYRPSTSSGDTGGDTGGGTGGFANWANSNQGADYGPEDDTQGQRKKAEKQLRFISLSDIRKNLIGPQYLVKPFIEKDTVAVWFGESGAYKTFVVLDLSLCIAHGIDYHGRKTHQGPVFYICGEGHGGMGRRIEAWHIHNKINADAPFYMSEVPAQILSQGNAEAVKAEIADMCEAHNQMPALIVIDTLSTNLGDGDESSNSDIARFLVGINTAIRLPFKAAVIVVHHVGHGDKDRERGAYAIRGNSDSRVKIEAQTGQRCAMFCKKMKDGPDFAPVAFQTHQVDIPGVLDNYGEGVNSLAVEMVDYVEEGDEKKLSPQKAQALGVLQEMYREKGDNMVNRGNSRTDARVFLSEWQDKLQACKIIKDRKQARTNIKNALLKDNVVTVEGKFIYLLSMAEAEKDDE